MTETFKQLLCNQFAATFDMFESSVRACPESTWNERVVELKTCQVAFHALFFTDLYLDQNVSSMRLQEFHCKHRDTFGDYEELEEREQRQTYSREFMLEYLEHCRCKVRRRIPEETDKTLREKSNFPRQDFNRAELLALTVRHLQHHVAQLGLKTRQDGGEAIGWVSSATLESPHA